MKHAIMILLAMLFLFSCKKDENQPEPQPTPEEPAFNLALEIGNYWVYNHYRIDSGHIEVPMNRMDCTWVDRDTVINNFNYVILENEGHLLSLENKQIVRDSAGYLVNNSGEIFFSSTNFTDTLYRFVTYYPDETILYVLTAKMEKPDQPVEVEAGSFEVINFKSTIAFTQNLGGGSTQYLNAYYADSIGMVMDTYKFASSTSYYERRLVNYHTGN
ncbi:MAG: hypothetical protein PF694_14725 [Bacteroidetes bacterium]|jgi:hypothetical protein|nr:hypothetical protein [Bacteroidota bacterium]